nr:unnamed protein product [Digitaria exilis]
MQDPRTKQNVQWGLLGCALCVVSGGPDTSALHRGKCQEDHVGDGPRSRAAPAIALRPPPSFSKSVRSPMLPCTCKRARCVAGLVLLTHQLAFGGGIHPRSTTPLLLEGRPASPTVAVFSKASCLYSSVGVANNKPAAQSGHWRRRYL